MKPETDDYGPRDNDGFIKYIDNSKAKYSGFLCPRGEYPHERELKEKAESEMPVVENVSELRPEEIVDLIENNLKFLVLKLPSAMNNASGAQRTKN